MSFNSEGYKRAIENELTIINKQKIEVPFTLNRSQNDLIHQMQNYEEIVILKARKMGFSSVVLAIAVIKFLMGKNERCVSMSFDATASEKQLERAKHFIKAFELHNGVKIPFKYNSKHEMAYEGIDKDTGRPFTNTLRIGTAKSGSFGRGDDISLLHVTETAFCDDMDALRAGVGEACLPGAPKIFETTANGYNNFKTFYNDAEEGKNGYHAIFYSPEWEYSKEFIEKKRAGLGRIGIQEYPLNAKEAFLTSGDCYFDTFVLGKMLENCEKEKTIDLQFESMSKSWKQYRKIDVGEFLLFPVDTCSGGGDNTTCGVISKTKIDNPFIYASDQTTTEFIPELVRTLEAVFDYTGVKPCVALERNRGGDFLMDRIAAMNHLGKFTIMLMPDFGKDNTEVLKGDTVARTNKLGWDTNSATRPKMLEEFQEVMNKSLLRVYDPEVIGECLSFIKKNGRPEAEAGSKDDRVMSLTIGWQMYLYQTIPQKSNNDMAGHEEAFLRHKAETESKGSGKVFVDGLYVG